MSDLQQTLTNCEIAGDFDSAAATDNHRYQPLSRGLLANYDGELNLARHSSQLG